MIVAPCGHRLGLIFPAHIAKSAAGGNDQRRARIFDPQFNRRSSMETEGEQGSSGHLVIALNSSWE
jgi:hypothetical protein